jgi:putative ABC transport system permease protein
VELRSILAILRRQKILALLLILEIAVSCAISCNAVFLIHQRLKLLNLPSGIAENEIVQVQLSYISSSTDAKAQTQADLTALRWIAGVKQVALARYLPFTLDGSASAVVKLTPEQQEKTLEAETYFGQNLLPTLGARLVEGRDFRQDEYVDFDMVVAGLNRGNRTILPPVMIITQTMAERLWPGQRALGKTIYVGDGIPFTVIGVVANLASPHLREGNSEYSMIWPLNMTAADGASYIIRCSPADRATVLKTVVNKLQELSPNRVVLIQRTYDEARRKFFARDRFMVGILVGVNATLLIVTALGIVGLTSFWVAQRHRTIGVLRALGATRANILRYFQTENFLLATIGIALGMIMAYGINMFLMLHYELPRLPAVYLPIGAIALWLIGQLAVLAPALRAASVQPVVAMRGN